MQPTDNKPMSNSPQPEPVLGTGSTAHTPIPTVVMPDIPFHLSNLDGFIQTIEFVPTYKPSRFVDQVVLVSSGGSSRAYFYDTKPSSSGWKYTTLT